jgi:hypothetical protein
MENYISREEIINLAYKQYKFWSNLAVEKIKSIIKDNTPNINQVTLPAKAPSIQENFHNFLIFKEKEEYLGLKNMV